MGPDGPMNCWTSVPRPSPEFLACARNSTSPRKGRGEVFSHPALGRRRVELQDFSTAIRLGGMRAGDEGAADLGAVPAGLHAETQRLFGFDMTRREILHGMLSSLKRS